MSRKRQNRRAPRNRPSASNAPNIVPVGGVDKDLTGDLLWDSPPDLTRKDAVGEVVAVGIDHEAAVAELLGCPDGTPIHRSAIEPDHHDTLLTVPGPAPHTLLGLVVSIGADRDGAERPVTPDIADGDWWFGITNHMTADAWIPVVTVTGQIGPEALFNQLSTVFWVDQAQVPVWRAQPPTPRPIRVAFVDSLRRRVVTTRDYWVSSPVAHLTREYLTPPLGRRDDPLTIFNNSSLYMADTFNPTALGVGSAWSPLLETPATTRGSLPDGLGHTEAPQPRFVGESDNSPPASDAAVEAVIDGIADRITDGVTSRRWTRQGHPVGHDDVAPGDIPALAAFYAQDIVVSTFSYGRCPPRLLNTSQPALDLLSAQSYWLPPGSEAAVLRSRPPDPDDFAAVTLPYPKVIVWFAQPLGLPDGHIPDVWPQIRNAVCSTNNHSRPPERCHAVGGEPTSALAVASVAPERCRIEGVALGADDDGRPTDHVGWLLRTPNPPGRDPHYRTVVPASRSAAGWSNMLDLLTSVIAWGDWTPAGSAPAGSAPAGPNRGERRRRERRDSRRSAPPLPPPPRTLVLRAPRPRGTDGEPAPTDTNTDRPPRSSPVTHLRRGHFRRQAVGPRTEDRRVTIWIPPTVVLPDGAHGPDRIYTLPPVEPAAAPSAGDR